MNRAPIIRKRAEKQVAEIYDWYEKQSTDLGRDFLSCFELTLLSIEKNPLAFQLRHKNIRCILTPRFPYGVFYFVDNDKIVVVAVFHLSRNPKLWKS